MRREKGVCKICFGKLPDKYDEIGYCHKCAVAEVKRIKKYYRSSLIGGIVFTVVAFLFITIVKIVFADKMGIVIDTDYGGTGYIFIMSFINGIVNLSVQTQIYIYLICFIVPFGRYVHLIPDTSDMGMAGLGVMLAELAVSAVSGLFFMVIRAVRLTRISNLLKDDT